jgi:hypothetical protein
MFMRKIYLFIAVFCCALMVSVPTKAIVELDGIRYDIVKDADLGVCGHVVQISLFNNYSHLSGDVAIPETVEGIGTIHVIEKNAFIHMTPTVNMTLPKTIRKIGEMAYYDATGLQCITLNEGLIIMEIEAFYGCSNLKSVNIPTTLTSIPALAFSNCTSLTSIVIPSATTTVIKRQAFSGCTALESVNGGSADPLPVQIIEEQAFSNCKHLSVIRLSDNLERIGKFAFAECYNLESILLPASLQVIEEGAFKNSGIKFVNAKWTTPPIISRTVFDGVDLANCVLYVPQGCRAAYRAADVWKEFGQILVPGEVPVPTDDTKIDGLYYEFHDDFTAKVIEHVDNKKLSGVVNIPSFVNYEGYTYTVTKIEKRAFMGCDDITSIVFPNTIEEIPKQLCQACPNLQTVTFPSSLTKIGDFAFGDCFKLKDINLPATLTELGIDAFYLCQSITSVTIPSGVKVIPKNCFASCQTLTNVQLPEGITEIQDFAFAACYLLKTITLPSSLTTMGYGVFAFDTKLASIKSLRQEPPAAQDTTFGAISLDKCILYVPYDSKSLYETATGWRRFAKIQEKGVNEKIQYNGLYYQLQEDFTAYVTYESNDENNYKDLIGEITVEDKIMYQDAVYKVNMVGPSAFANSKNITKINLPEIMDEIHAYAFEHTNVYEINIPATLKRLSNLAFKNSVIFTTYMDEQGAVYYDGCLLYHEKDYIFGPYHVKEGTRLIASNAFSQDQYITQLYIPEGVQCICTGAIDYMFALQILSLPSTLCYLASGFCSSYCGNLQTIYNYSKIPLSLPNSGYFDSWSNEQLANKTVYVPYGSLNAYGTANKWEYFNIEEMLPVYTVTFQDYDGHLLKTEQVNIGEDATAPDITEREGYEFAGWDVNFSDVQADMVVTAQYVEIQVPEVRTLKGAFSVAENKKVAFAQGNLRYNADDDVWALSNNQFDMRGKLNTQASSEYNGWIDLFGFATSESLEAGMPWETSTNVADYSVAPGITRTIAGTDYDWLAVNELLNAGDKTWRLMSKAEWEYLLNTRPNAANLRGQAVVNDVQGYILLPDEWQCPSTVEFVANPNNLTTNVFSLAEWEQLENAGAVFLPATGYRYGRKMIAQGIGTAFYWTGDFTTDNSTARVLMISSTSAPSVIDAIRAYGCPIRPVRDIQPDEEMTVGPITNEPLPMTIKVLRDNQILIQSGEITYTIQGQEIK